MGCCQSEETATSNDIGDRMNQGATEEMQENKLLLLGTGSSGKSTLFRGLKIIKGEKFNNIDLEETKAVIRSNLVKTSRNLWEKCMDLGLKEPSVFGSYSAGLFGDDPDFQAVVHFDNADSTVSGIRNMKSDDLIKIGQIIERIWSKQAIKFTYANRGGRFAAYENMDYFFDKTLEVMSEDYFPSDEDMLKCRQKTTGITTWEWGKDHWIFKIFDVGGQRNERRKWIQLFNGVHAVLFLAALNHFNYVLYEKEDTNAMHESLKLFEEIVTQKYFRLAEIILFLNKDDLFRKAIGEGHSLSVCFNSRAKRWEGDSYDGPEWPGPDYEPRDEVSWQNDDENFTPIYEAAKEFILEQYLAKNPIPTRVIHPHVMVGTDTENLAKVFDQVQDIVIRANLARRGVDF